MIGKKVGDLIGQDMKVKLGAKDGSGFVFCGNFKDADVCEIDESIRNGYLNSLENAINTIKILNKKELSYEAYVREMASSFKKAVGKIENPKKIVDLEERYTPSNLGFHHWVASINKKLEHAKHTRRKINSILNNYTTIADRIITDVYKSIDEDNTLILLYKGSEHGRAWTTKEYEEGESL